MPYQSHYPEDKYYQIQNPDSIRGAKNLCGRSFGVLLEAQHFFQFDTALSKMIPIVHRSLIKYPKQYCDEYAAHL